MSTLPYPGKYESHENWMHRCDEWEQRRKAEQEDRYASAPDGRGLTERQKEKLAKAEAKLPDGWSYTVTNDNHQIGLHSRDESYLGCATRDGRNPISAHCQSATQALYLNRACAAVWGQQPCWYNVFTPEEWKAATCELKSRAILRK